MKLAEIIAIVDDVRPNGYEKTIKTKWINEVEFKVVDEVLNRARGNDIEFTPYDYDADAERELFVPEQFSDVYEHYLYSKIDNAQNEIDRYNNDVTMFQSAWNAYAGWYRRHHMPKAVMR